MVNIKVKFNKEDCIGCGMCAEECPSNWSVKETPDGRKAKPRSLTLASVGCNQRAADSCPVGAIEIVKKGKSSDDDLDMYEDDF